MKETLAYNVLQTMQERPYIYLNAVERWKLFEKDYYHYDGIWKRLSDLKKYWLVISEWSDSKWYMLYEVSDKWLCIKSFDDYKKATYKPRTPKPKKTREESAVKKESKLYPTWYETTKEDLLANPSDHPSGIYYDTETWEEIVVKKECKMIGEDAWKPDYFLKRENTGIWYIAWTQITTSHRNEEWDIVIWYSTNSPLPPKQPRYKRLLSVFMPK